MIQNSQYVSYCWSCASLMTHSEFMWMLEVELFCLPVLGWFSFSAYVEIAQFMNCPDVNLPSRKLEGDTKPPLQEQPLCYRGL